MSSISEIRSNLHNKIRIVNREDIFHTPYKPLVDVIVDNKHNKSSNSFRDLKSAAKSFRMSNTSTQDKPPINNIGAFQVKYMQMPKHKCRSDIGNRTDRTGSFSKLHGKRSGDLGAGDSAILPNIQMKKFRRKAKTRPKKLKVNWQEVESKLFKIDSTNFYNKIQQITKEYKHYVQE